MEQKIFKLNNDKQLLVREAASEDAVSVMDYINRVSGESDFLTFGPGEFKVTEQQEKEIIENSRKSKNRLLILGIIDNKIAGILNFSGGQQTRTRHCGELGLTVGKQYWGMGTGSFMIDALVEWAKCTGIVKKINLRVRTDNRRAILLYKRKGFIKEGTIRKEIFFDGRYYDHYWMSCELD